MSNGGKSTIAAGDEGVRVSELTTLEKKVKQLEQMQGRKTMETEILRDALEIAQAKSLCRACPFSHRMILSRPQRYLSTATSGGLQRYPAGRCIRGLQRSLRKRAGNRSSLYGTCPMQDPRCTCPSPKDSNNRSTQSYRGVVCYRV